MAQPFHVVGGLGPRLIRGSRDSRSRGGRRQTPTGQNEGSDLRESSIDAGTRWLPRRKSIGSVCKGRKVGVVGGGCGVAPQG